MYPLMIPSQHVMISLFPSSLCELGGLVRWQFFLVSFQTLLFNLKDIFHPSLHCSQLSGLFSMTATVYAKSRGCNHKKIASFRHKTQKFFFGGFTVKMFLGKRHKWHWVSWQTNLANFPKFNAPPLNSMSPIQSPRQQIHIILVCSCVKNAASWPPHHPRGCHEIGSFFVGVTPSKFWLHSSQNWWQTSQNKCFTIIILASTPTPTTRKCALTHILLRGQACF